jgi:hypothetical protein
MFSTFCMLITPQIPVWDELWWDDGLLHSQPVLDGTITQQLQSPVRAAEPAVAVVLTISAGDAIVRVLSSVCMYVRDVD